MHPGAERRLPAIEENAAGMKLKLGRVVEIGRPERANHGQIIDAAANVWPPVAHLDPALAALAETDLQRQDFGIDLRLTGEGTEVLVDLRRLEDARIGR